MAKNLVRRIFSRLGYGIYNLKVPLAKNYLGNFPVDFDSFDIELYRFVKPFTMTSPERIYALRKSVEYILTHNIQGDIVECGVWKGGSMMAIAKTLIKQGVTNRRLYLFDTFEGMSTPIHLDKNYSGQTAVELLSKESKITSHTWAYSSLDEVKQNLQKSGYDEENIIFVKGKVEDTLPSFAPKHISLLRLDTDWYESTYHELLHLYPLLSIGGVLIIDDYGHWQGAKLAVDQYFNQNKLKLLLHRIDYTGRICVKLEN